jgi:hypothetical protein
MRPGRDDSTAPVAGFWARRRAAVRAEAEAAQAATAAGSAATGAIAEAAPLPEAGEDRPSDAEILAGLGLRDPETMGLGDDFAAFLRAEVPEHLRRRALRRLWRSNPLLANLDGLVDHGEDYTDAATVVPGMRTAYQVGRGFVTEVLALADRAANEATPEAAETAVETAAETPAGMAAEPPAETLAEPRSEALAEPAPDPVPPFAAATSAPPPDPARPPRHMRFVFAA